MDVHWNGPGYRDPIDSPDLRTLSMSTHSLYMFLLTWIWETKSIILQFTEPDVPENKTAASPSQDTSEILTKNWKSKLWRVCYPMHIPSTCGQGYIYENDHVLVTQRLARSSNHRGSAYREAGWRPKMHGLSAIPRRLAMMSDIPDCQDLGIPFLQNAPDATPVLYSFRTWMPWIRTRQGGGHLHTYPVRGTPYGGISKIHFPSDSPFQIWILACSEEGFRGSRYKSSLWQFEDLWRRFLLISLGAKKTLSPDSDRMVDRRQRISHG